jgi:hypothetical protein
MNPSDGAKSSPESIADCEAAIDLFARRKQEVESGVRELRETEDIPSGKIFAKDIFNLQQEKHCLETEIQILRNKIRRIRNDQES